MKDFCLGAFAVALLVACFLMGKRSTEVKLCPVVQGEKVVSTSATKDEQFCTYSRIYAKTTNRRKV